MTGSARDAPTSAARSVRSGALCGIGLAAFVDETIFHQLLHWHHFYDRSTTTAGLVSDGLFHAGGFVCVVVGLFLMADAVRRAELVPKRWWGALLVGAGGFQLYDGVVQHKLLRLHQIRYDVPITPYDVTWDAVALALVVGGLVLVLTGDARVAGPGMLRTKGRRG
jgi:uncharacterized membrane protein